LALEVAVDSVLVLEAVVDPLFAMVDEAPVVELDPTLLDVVELDVVELDDCCDVPPSPASDPTLSCPMQPMPVPQMPNTNANPSFFIGRSSVKSMLRSIRGGGERFF
jgi:hypothetical protein